MNKFLDKLKAYVELMKPFNHSKSTLYYGFCSIVGSILASPYSLPLNASLGAAAAITTSAFAIYTLNDICDVEIDRINAPHRPLPSGRVGVLEAEALTAILLFISLTVACSVSLAVLTFTLLFSFLGIAYSVPPVRLKDSLLANACWGFGIASSVLCGASVAAITIRPAIAAFTLAFLTACCGFIKDLKDLEGDRAKAIHTLPAVLGEKDSIKFMTAASAVGSLLLVSNYFLCGFNPLYLAVIIVAVALLAYSALYLQVKPHAKDIYKKAYKMQAASGFLINIAFIIGALT